MRAGGVAWHLTSSRPAPAPAHASWPRSADLQKLVLWTPPAPRRWPCIAMGVAGWWEPILAVMLTLAAITAPVQLGGSAYGHSGAGDGHKANVWVSSDGSRVVVVLLLNGRMADRAIGDLRAASTP